MIRADVPDWEAKVADYRSASDKTRGTLRSQQNVLYDNNTDTRLDLYFPHDHSTGGKRLPVHIFVHGGYWRSFSKDDYAFVADTITACGAIAAIVDYALMPAVRMGALVSQLRRAARWLEENAESFGGDALAISASGHSAGAHLASFLICRAAHEGDVVLPNIRAALLVSGIYDLKPITQSFLQPELQLTTEEVERWSPGLASPRPDVEVTLLVGGAETTPFHEQAAQFEGHLAKAGTRTRLLTVPGEDHMTIVRELGRPNAACAEALAFTIG